MGVDGVRLQQEMASRMKAMFITHHCNKKERVVIQTAREFMVCKEWERSHWTQTLAAMESVAHGQSVSGESVHAWLASWGAPDEISPPQVGRQED